MSVSHRPSDETLAAFAAGRLDEGLALVVAAHLEMDAVSRQRLRDLEAVQGALLEAAEPIQLDADAGAVLAARHRDRMPEQPDGAPEPDMPRVLRRYPIGPWRRIGLGVAMRRVEVPGAVARVFMLQAGPGIALPHHKHAGLEWTTILSGAYEHQYGRFAAGDFDEADQEHVHTPRVDPTDGCVCLAALTDAVLFQGWLGRLLQPLVRL